MAEVVEYVLTDPQIARDVMTDGQPREGVCLTRYDDGAEGETLHMFYKVGDEVLSCLAENWPPA